MVQWSEQQQSLAAMLVSITALPFVIRQGSEGPSLAFVMKSGYLRCCLSQMLPPFVLIFREEFGGGGGVIGVLRAWFCLQGDKTPILFQGFFGGFFGLWCVCVCV